MSAMGLGAAATGDGSLAIGGWYDKNRNNKATDFLREFEPGEKTIATGEAAVAVGNGVIATGQYSAAFGVGAAAIVKGATAIGFDAVGDREYTVSVGSADTPRQIIHVAAGTEGHEDRKSTRLNSSH